MLKLKQQRKGISKRVMEEEIDEGFKAQAAFMEICYTGDYRNVQALLTRSPHIKEVFSRLFEYVTTGSFPANTTPEDMHDALAFVMNALVNQEMFGNNSITEIGNVVSHAYSRCKLDQAEGYPCFDTECFSGWFENGDSADLSIAEIAMLADMDEQSVRNAVQPDKEPGLKTYRNDSGRFQVDAKDAAKWLMQRRGFIARKIDESDIPEGHILVPFAKDGSRFGSHCQQTAGFKIGKKGEEGYVPSAQQALVELSQMKKSYWRRPNSNGRFGIVAAVEWKAVPESEL